MNLIALYLTLQTQLRSFFSSTDGNEQTGMLLNIVITVVIAGMLLTAMRTFLPNLWDQIMEQIQGLWDI